MSTASDSARDAFLGKGSRRAGWKPSNDGNAPTQEPNAQHKKADQHIASPLSFNLRYARQRTSETHSRAPAKHNTEITYPMIPPCNLDALPSVTDCTTLVSLLAFRRRSGYHSVFEL